MAKYVSYFVVSIDNEGQIRVDDDTATARFDEGFVWDLKNGYWLKDLLNSNTEAYEADIRATKILYDMIEAYRMAEKYVASKGMLHDD